MIPDEVWDAMKSVFKEFVCFVIVFLFAVALFLLVMKQKVF